MHLVVVGPGRAGLPAEADPAVGRGGCQAHRGGRLGHVEPGELAGAGLGVEELQPVVVGGGCRVQPLVNKDCIGHAHLQAGVEGGDGGEVGASEPFGPLQAVLVGATQVPGVEPDGSAPADGDLAAGVGRGVDRDLGDDGGQQGQLEAGLGRDDADAPVEAAVAVGVLGDDAVGVGPAPSQGGGVGEGGDALLDLAHLDVARAGGQAGLAGSDLDVLAALPSVDAESGAGGSAGVGGPAELDGPSVGGGGGPGRQVLDGGTHQPDAEGLEGDQRGHPSGGHIVDLEDHIVGGFPELVAVGLPAEVDRSGLGQGHPVVGQRGVSGLNQFARGQGLAVLAHVEDAPKAGDDHPLAVGVRSGDGLVDERTGRDTEVRYGLDEGSAVGLVNDDDLHVAGDLADQDAVTPLLDDEGEVELALLAGGVPAEGTGDGVDGEGGRAPALARAAEPGRVLIGGYRPVLGTNLASSLLRYAKPVG
ncbi:hypothetical protein [Spirosoma knui]